MLIRVHSVVDVITNSSTVVYTMASRGTINAIEAMVDSILEATGYDRRADDLFEFKLAYDEDMVQDWRKEHLTGLDPDFGEKSWRERGVILEQMKLDPPDWWDDYEPSDYEYENIYVSVTAKDETFAGTALALSKLHDLFRLEGDRNG